MESNIFIGHPHTQNRLAAFRAESSDLLLGQVAVITVIAQMRVTTGSLMTRRDFLRGGIGFVSISPGKQLICYLFIDIHPFALPVGAVGAAFIHALVPI